MSKKKNKSPVVFALSTLTHEIPKFHYDENGERINAEFNNRMYAKKAYKAYLKGQRFFVYKSNVYTVPRIDKQALDEYLNSVSVEELESIDILKELENNNE